MPARNNAYPFPILISGFIGSGKSTLAKKLAKKYRAKYVSASQIHRELVLEHMSPKERKHAREVGAGFWETVEGKKGTDLRLKHLNIDREVDIRLKRTLFHHPHSITDARLMPWLYTRKALRVWLQVSEKESAKRVGERDRMHVKHVVPSIRKRFNADKKIFKKLYGIEMGTDFAPFDLVLNNETLTPAQTYRLVDTFIQSKIKNQRSK